jgi:tetratricopeptide (TPR) repeat protein
MIKISFRKIWVFLSVGLLVAWLNSIYVYNMDNIFLYILPVSITGSKLDKSGLSEGFKLLKTRQDHLASEYFEKVLVNDPGNPDALWAKAEILRRSRKYNEAEVLLTQVLNKDPKHVSALISSAYIRYQYNELNPARALLQKVLDSKDLDNERAALALTLMGAINSKKSAQGLFTNKVFYGLRVKGFFVKAVKLAPDLAEARLGLGTFYLLAPAVAGGNINKACAELEYAIKLAPDFATPCARLAQICSLRGDKEKYNFYISRAKKLDPENEVVKELESCDVSGNKK